MDSPRCLTRRELDYLRKRGRSKFNCPVGLLLVGALLTSSWLDSKISELSLPDPAALAGMFLVTLTSILVVWFNGRVSAARRSLTVEQCSAYGVYLRPFAEDVASVDRNALRDTLAGLPIIGLLVDRSINFDELATRSLRRQGLALISLGNPGDFLPPVGSTRIYPSDSCWKPVVRRLVAQAQVIFVRAQDTHAVVWELSAVRRGLLSHRTVLHVGLDERERQAWPGAVAALRTAGFEVPRAFPGKGSIICFRNDGVAFLAASEVSSARGIAAALEALNMFDAAKKENI